MLPFSGSRLAGRLLAQRAPDAPSPAPADARYYWHGGLCFAGGRHSGGILVGGMPVLSLPTGAVVMGSSHRPRQNRLALARLMASERQAPPCKTRVTSSGSHPRGVRLSMPGCGLRRPPYPRYNDPCPPTITHFIPTVQHLHHSPGLEHQLAHPHHHQHYCCIQVTLSGSDSISSFHTSLAPTSQRLPSCIPF